MNASFHMRVWRASATLDSIHRPASRFICGRSIPTEINVRDFETTMFDGYDRSLACRGANVLRKIQAQRFQADFTSCHGPLQRPGMATSVELLTLSDSENDCGHMFNGV